MKKIKRYILTFWNRRYLLYELVKKGIKLKYRRSYLGIIWSLLEPILSTAVLTIVFGILFANNNPTFPMYILCGRLLYTFFSQSTKAASKSIRSNAGMIRKVYVPKYLYPLSSVLYNYVIFAISLLVLILLGFYCRIQPGLRLFALVIPLFLIFCMAYGVGLILATINVFFRDVEYIWDVVLMIVMYTCAIFYYPERLMKSGFDWILKYNPLYGTIQNFRNIILGDPIDQSLMIYGMIFSIGVLVIGNLMFYKNQDKFILYI